MKQIKNIYEKYWLDIGAFLLIAFLVGGGLFLIKTSKEESSPIEITGGEAAGSSVGEAVKGKETSDFGQDGSESELININTADLGELDKLPGIGEKTAEKIMDYREENGDFASKEDIKNVSGIGDAKYSEIEDRITVE